MPRKHIYFTEDTLKELQSFVKKEYGSHRAMSLIVQKAVKRFLEEENVRQGSITKNVLD